MRERPILMSDAMVAAILRGEKHQTRRIVKLRPNDGRCAADCKGALPAKAWTDPGVGQGGYLKVPCEDGAAQRVFGPYHVGLRLWVREAWGRTESSEGIPCVKFRADGDTRVIGANDEGDEYAIESVPPVRCDEPERWRPSIFMPRWASRLTLAVTEVRVERVQSIFDADIAAEGVTAEAVESLWRAATKKERWAALPGFRESEVTFRRQSPRALWQIGWSLINGRASWDANPWVWAISFRVVDAAARAA